MAIKRGYYYYTKEEIDENHYDKADVDTILAALLAVEDAQITVRRVDTGPYTTTVTGKKIHLGGDVYAYLLEAEISASGIAPSTTGMKHLTVTYPQAFTTFFGGGTNAALVGSINSVMRYVDMTASGIDLWIDSDVTVKSNVLLNFIAVGEIEESQNA